jgi:hypothetical protein
MENFTAEAQRAQRKRKGKKKRYSTIETDIWVLLAHFPAKLVRLDSAPAISKFLDFRCVSFAP